MPQPLIFLTVPGLRDKDLWLMPKLKKLVGDGDWAQLIHSFPCVTWPGQANMLTGKLPAEHGVVANGFFGVTKKVTRKTKSKCGRPGMKSFRNPKFGTL